MRSVRWKTLKYLVRQIKTISSNAENNKSLSMRSDDGLSLARVVSEISVCLSIQLKMLIILLKKFIRNKLSRWTARKHPFSQDDWSLTEDSSLIFPTLRSASTIPPSLIRMKRFIRSWSTKINSMSWFWTDSNSIYLYVYQKRYWGPIIRDHR